MRKYFEETARFANNDRTVISVDMEEDGVIVNRAIIVSPNKAFIEFSEQVEIGKVHENTEAIAKDMMENEQKYLDNLADLLLFKNNKKHEGINVFELKDEDLFQAKLKIFEIDEIKNSEDKAAKVKIRKADNIFAALAYSVALINKNQ